MPDFVKTFEARRDLVCDRLSRAPGLACGVPDGAFYVFVSCRNLLAAETPDGRTIQSDADLALYLLERLGVAVVPGSSFLAEGYVRISYAASTQALERACQRILAACTSLAREVV